MSDLVVSLGYRLCQAEKRINELEAERDTATRALGEALEVRTWTEVERDGMAEAYRLASEKHGHYETLFAVGAWLLRHRAERIQRMLKGED